MENVQIIRRGVPVTGTLHLTAHHLIFSINIPEEERRRTSSAHIPLPKPRELWITYPIISRCTYRSKSPGSGLYPSIRIQCKDFTFFTLQFSDDSKAQDVFESIKALACKMPTIQGLYAFTYRPNRLERDSDGWAIYSAPNEWKRQGVGVDGSRWRLSTINHDYKVCLT